MHVTAITDGAASTEARFPFIQEEEDMHSRLISLAAVLLATAFPAVAADLHAVMRPAPSSGQLQVEVGDFATTGNSLVPAGYCPNNQADMRRQNTAITFSPAFSAPPAVSVSLKSLDAGDGRNIRVNAYAINVTTTGATVVIETWCDTNLYSASGTIIAVGTR